MNVRHRPHARRLRSAAGSINSGRHILAFTMRRALRKRRVFDFVPSYLKYCNRTNFHTRFNFVYFVLLAESTKFSSVRKPYMYTSVSATTIAVRKFLAYESRQTLEYEIFLRTKISAITVLQFYKFSVR